MSSISPTECPEVASSPRENNHDLSKKRRRWLLYTSAALLLMALIAVAFLAGVFLSSQRRGGEGNDDASRRNGDNGKPAEMSCAWMRQCRRKRSGSPPLLIISSDGFARRYLDAKKTPTILKMGECGSRAESLRPSFPTKTFPNHYTIATGLHPGHHGIVDNEFRAADGTTFNKSIGRYYGGEPIWSTAVRHGKTARVHMWPGPSDAIDGVEPSFYYKKYKRLGLLDKIDTVIDWLTSEAPPDLTMLYLEQPDEDGHAHGPDSYQVRDAVLSVDAMVRYALNRLHDAGVLGGTNIVFLSDHGMRAINISESIILADLDPSLASVNLKAVNTHVHFYENASLTALQGKKGVHYRIYRSAEDVPLRYHYDHANIGFPFLAGNPGEMFFQKKADLDDWNAKYTDKGNHGWDNLDKRIQAIFFAVGPSIARNLTLPPFQNIELYNLFADLLEVPAALNDGVTGLLDGILMNPPHRPSSHQIKTRSCAGASKVPSEFHLASADPTVCSKLEANSLFVLSSTQEPIALEFAPSSAAGTQPAIEFVRREFRASPLIERAIEKLAERKGARIQIGRFASPSTLLFAVGFWCEEEGGKAMETQCDSEGNMRAEAYAIPAQTEENFNDLALDELLFDNRVSIGEIERATRLQLLPQSMDAAVRRRAAQMIPISRWA